MTTRNNQLGPIPGIAIVLAVVAFIACSIFFTRVIGKEHEQTVPAARILLGVLLGMLVAGYVLLAGYVNRDARRRGMRHVVWTFIVVLVPNAIGFILYFLLRSPLLGRCPRCHTTVRTEFNYCPKCNLQLNPICAHCGKVARPGDQFCPYCGKRLDIQPPPAAAIPE